MKRRTAKSKSIAISDREWPEARWQELLGDLVNRELVTWQQVGALVLGHLNPPQVGTSLASNPQVQAHYKKGETWQAVKTWFYEQPGICADCGTRLELQAHHIVPKQVKGKRGLYRLDNFQLLCRRCNVIKRPSHKRGGQTFLTAEAALMWLLFAHQPRTYEEFEGLCRGYGLTMANIRFQEAWAMAMWLGRQRKYPFRG